jgi:hypothetical protein
VRRIIAQQQWLLNGYLYQTPRMGADPVRLVTERDYRNLLAVARAAEKYRARDIDGENYAALCDALDRLNKERK